MPIILEILASDKPCPDEGHPIEQRVGHVVHTEDVKNEVAAELFKGSVKGDPLEQLIPIKESAIMPSHRQGLRYALSQRYVFMASASPTRLSHEMECVLTSTIRNPCCLKRRTSACSEKWISTVWTP